MGAHSRTTTGSNALALTGRGALTAAAAFALLGGGAAGTALATEGHAPEHSHENGDWEHGDWEHGNGKHGEKECEEPGKVPAPIDDIEEMVPETTPDPEDPDEVDGGATSPVTDPIDEKTDGGTAPVTDPIDEKTGGTPKDEDDEVIEDDLDSEGTEPTMQEGDEPADETHDGGQFDEEGQAEAEGGSTSPILDMSMT